MTPRTYLRKYRDDPRLITGQYYPAEPLPVERGDRVGVVLFHLGEPETADDVAPFLYNVFMDPAVIDVPGGRLVRSWLSRLFAAVCVKSTRREYEAIGGGAPVNRLTGEQAESLEALLNRRFGAATGATFHTYVAMRYWHPFSEEAARRMQHDGITKVVLLPLFPQYSKTTVGSALAYWWRLEQESEIPAWPTTRATEYAAHPKYVQAISERIDEALQRFPKQHRDTVPLLFSAHGTTLREMQERGDPYCCHIHATVDHVMARRGHDRPFDVAFHGKVGPVEWLTPSASETLKRLVARGHTSVLVIPIALVTEHFETTYALDIDLRDQAAQAGIGHFEVMPALNCHALFIEALAEVALACLAPLDAVNGNGQASAAPALPPTDPARHDAATRSCRCPQCRYLAEPQRWSPASPAPRPTPRPDASGG